MLVALTCNSASFLQARGCLLKHSVLVLEECSVEVNMTLDQLQARRGQVEMELAALCMGGVLDRARIDRLSQDLAMIEREIEMLTASFDQRGEPTTRPVVHRLAFGAT